MEILANNGHEVADRVGDVGLSGACEVENGLMTATTSALSGDRIRDPNSLHLEDENAIVNTKKRAFDEGLKELRSPAKKLAIRGSSDVEVDSALLDSSLGDAMLIDTAWGEPGGRCKVSDGQAVPGSPRKISGSITACTSVPTLSAETGIIVDGGASRVCEAAEGNSDLQNVDVILASVDSSVDTTKCDGELATSNSAELEVKGMDAMNGILDSHLPTQVEDDVVKEECMVILQNGHVDMGIEEHVISNVAAEEGIDVVMDAEESVPDTAGDGGVLQSSPSGGGSGKIKDGGHAVGCSSALADEVCVSEARTTRVSVDSQITQTCNDLGESVVADGADQRETADEEGANNDSGISEVDELQMEKADASKALEMKMVEVIMEGLAFEVAGSRNDATSNPLSDDGLDVREQDGNGGKDLTNGTVEEDKCTELFEPVVQLPEHSGGTNGFVGSAVGSEDLNSDPAREDSLRNQRLGDSAGAAVASSKDPEFPQYSGSEKGGDSMDRQDSDVATPSAATSAQSRSPGLKSRLKLKGQGEVSMRQSPTLNGVRGFVMKEVLLKEAPASAKLLLQSGLLDGHHVRYMGRGGHIMLTGIIQEGGVLCDCSSCKGVQVVNVSAFEKHAGSSARHPSDFIFLENGKCLKDILEIGWNANKQKMNVMDVLKSAIGEVGGEKVQIRSLEHPLIAIQPALKKLPQPRPLLDTKPRVPVDVKPRTPQGDTKPRMPSDTKARSTPEVKARGSDPRASIPRLDRTPREKETASPPVLNRESSGANLHKALFLPGGLEDDTEVGYYVKGQKSLAGVKKGAGILCSCCQQVISCSLFEQHAGWGSRRNPYTSIYLADGRSLHDAAQSLVVEQNVKQEGVTPAKIEHLDQCVECGDSGDLQLCTGCPNAYHQDCLGSADSSSFGEFFCPDCQEQRFGGTKDRRRSMAKRRSKGAAKTLLTKDRVTGRCSRLLQVPEAVVLGGCVFCKSGDFAKTGFGPKTTLLCDQCEREYHVGCLKKHGLEDLKELPEGEWFCGQDCKHIHSILSLLVSNGPEPLADSIISKVLKTNQARLEASEDATESSCSGFEWQLLHGRGGDPSNGKALAEAVQIFSECFDPIADGVSGGDLIPLMVYRRSLRDQDFGGIYCVVLKYDNRVVSTALIRVFGRQLAELPLLATNPSHQGQGHCKALLLSIERLLGVLRVERLALPAAEGAEGIWLNKFGFRRMAEGQVEQFHSDLNMMVFTGSFMLEKEIPPLEITGSRKT